jgi:hypothetical protein
VLSQAIANSCEDETFARCSDCLGAACQNFLKTYRKMFFKYLSESDSDVVPAEIASNP